MATRFSGNTTRPSTLLGGAQQQPSQYFSASQYDQKVAGARGGVTGAGGGVSITNRPQSLMNANSNTSSSVTSNHFVWFPTSFSNQQIKQPGSSASSPLSQVRIHRQKQVQTEYDTTLKTAVLSLNSFDIGQQQQSSSSSSESSSVSVSNPCISLPLRHSILEDFSPVQNNSLNVPLPFFSSSSSSSMMSSASIDPVISVNCSIPVPAGSSNGTFSLECIITLGAKRTVTNVSPLFEQRQQRVRIHLSTAITSPEIVLHQNPGTVQPSNVVSTNSNPSSTTTTPTKNAGNRSSTIPHSGGASAAGGRFTFYQPPPTTTANANSNINQQQQLMNSTPPLLPKATLRIPLTGIPKGGVWFHLALPVNKILAAYLVPGVLASCSSSSSSSDPSQLFGIHPEHLIANTVDWIGLGGVARIHKILCSKSMSVIPLGEENLSNLALCVPPLSMASSPTKVVANSNINNTSSSDLYRGTGSGVRTAYAPPRNGNTSGDPSSSSTSMNSSSRIEEGSDVQLSSSSYNTPTKKLSTMKPGEAEALHNSDDPFAPRQQQNTSNYFGNSKMTSSSTTDYNENNNNNNQQQQMMKDDSPNEYRRLVHNNNNNNGNTASGGGGGGGRVLYNHLGMPINPKKAGSAPVTRSSNNNNNNGSNQPNSFEALLALTRVTAWSDADDDSQSTSTTARTPPNEYEDNLKQQPPTALMGGFGFGGARRFSAGGNLGNNNNKATPWRGGGGGTSSNPSSLQNTPSKNQNLQQQRGSSSQAVGNRFTRTSSTMTSGMMRNNSNAMATRNNGTLNNKTPTKMKSDKENTINNNNSSSAADITPADIVQRQSSSKVASSSKPPAKQQTSSSTITKSSTGAADSSSTSSAGVVVDPLADLRYTPVIKRVVGFGVGDMTVIHSSSSDDDDDDDNDDDDDDDDDDTDDDDDDSSDDSDSGKKKAGGGRYSHVQSRYAQQTSTTTPNKAPRPKVSSTTSKVAGGSSFGVGRK